jgi:hypothetical protein
MVLEDVLALPDEPAVVAEGTTITPSMTPASSLAIWLAAEPTVRAHRNRQRGWGAAGDEADLIQARQLMAELDRVSATVIDTSHHTERGETITEIEALAATWIATRPTAHSRRERQALIRDGNAAIVAQYRGGTARSGNSAGDSLVRTYDCECGDLRCTAFVERSLGSLPEPFDPSTEPILAPGHHQASS